MFSCTLPAVEYWDRAQVILLLSIGDATLPTDVYEKCETCEHVGWRWSLPAAAVCFACRSSRLGARQA